MTPTPTHLQNTQAVVDAFGYWPSFHDAPLFDVAMEGDELRFTVHGFVMTNEIDERGYYRLIKHHLVRFRFCGVRDNSLPLDGSESLRVVGGSDILMSLEIGQPDVSGEFAVICESAIGGDLGGSFCARSGEILSVLPCQGDGKPTSPEDHHAR
ncbi:MAG: hypothetical protein RL095_3219 [Verrucomicrobiota bacterium]|jgi:hypothetical protein